MLSPIKVFIVDDSAVVRTTLTAIVQLEPSISVMGSANDPIIAMDKFSRLGWPDVIVLDIEMPNMDGLTFLKKIMAEHPTPVIICSSIAKKASSTALEALSCGAVEVIAKPEVGTKQFLEESKELFINAIRASAKAKVHTTVVAVPHKAAPIADNELKKNDADVMLPLKKQAAAGGTHNFVAIGSSTGGVQILEKILQELPSNVPPIVIVQHMPAGFTKSLADRLNRMCKIEVKEAEDGDKLLHGRALVAPGDAHIMIKRNGGSYTVIVKDGPKVSRHKPSVDVLFRSCANEAGSNAIGVILTGMGDDGAHGMKELKDTGAKTYAQDEKSCTVYGMPKMAVELGGVLKTATPEEIIEIIKRG